MSKIVLEDVTSLDAISVLNTNFDKIESELNDKVLYRNPPDGEPNTVLKDIDINGKRLYNLPAPASSSEPVRKADLDAAVLGDYVISSGVTSFNTRGGDVTLNSSDVITALGFSPISAAVTSFRAGVDSPRTGAVTLLGTDVSTALGYTPAPLVSPALTGIPTSPTATPGTSTTQLATTAFVTNAVTTATTGVITFNGRSGAVVPGSSDYGVAQISGAAPLASPAFTGNPTAPTQLTADNSTRLATTAYVTAKVGATTAGVTTFNSRAGAVSLINTDLDTAFASGPVNIASTGSSSTNTIKISRNATYSGGTPGYVNAAIYAETEVGAGVTSLEWGLLGVVHNYGSAGGDHTGVYGQGNVRSVGSGGVFGGCFEACDMTYPSVAASNLIGTESDVWCNGTDSGIKRVGVDVVVGDAKFIRTGVWGDKAYAGVGVRVTASLGHESKAAFNYGVLINSAEIASIALTSSGTYGIQSLGSHAVGIDLTGATHSQSAIRIKANDVIALEATNAIKLKYDGAGKIQFLNGSTPCGYVDVSGPNVSFNGGANVSSFNTRTGAVTLSSGDVTGALGFSPASLSGANTFSGSSNVFNNIVYASGGLNIGSGALASSSSGNVTFSATAGATALPANVAFFHRIVVDGTTYKIPVYNA